MPKVTFEVTPKQRKLMDTYSKVNWSDVLRRAVEREAARQELAMRLDEEFSDKDVQWATELVNEGIRKRMLREFGPNRGR